MGRAETERAVSDGGECDRQGDGTQKHGRGLARRRDGRAGARVGGAGYAPAAVLKAKRRRRLAHRGAECWLQTVAGVLTRRDVQLMSRILIAVAAGMYLPP